MIVCAYEDHRYIIVSRNTPFCTFEQKAHAPHSLHTNRWREGVCRVTGNAPHQYRIALDASSRTRRDTPHCATTVQRGFTSALLLPHQDGRGNKSIDRKDVRDCAKRYEIEYKILTNEKPEKHPLVFCIPLSWYYVDDCSTIG